MFCENVEDFLSFLCFQLFGPEEPPVSETDKYTSVTAAEDKGSKVVKAELFTWSYF